jgi:hypothetical protein
MSSVSCVVEGGIGGSEANERGEGAVREAPPNIPRAQVGKDEGDIDWSPSESVQASSCVEEYALQVCDTASASATSEAGAEAR